MTPGRPPLVAMVAPEGAPAQRHRLVDRARPGELLLEPRRVLVRLRLPLLGRNLLPPPRDPLLALQLCSGLLCQDSASQAVVLR